VIHTFFNGISICNGFKNNPKTQTSIRNISCSETNQSQGTISSYVYIWFALRDIQFIKSITSLHVYLTPWLYKFSPLFVAWLEPVYEWVNHLPYIYIYIYIHTYIHTYIYIWGKVVQRSRPTNESPSRRQTRIKSDIHSDQQLSQCFCSRWLKGFKIVTVIVQGYFFIFASTQ
jgi:hypothetical protein